MEEGAEYEEDVSLPPSALAVSVTVYLAVIMTVGWCVFEVLRQLTALSSVYVARDRNEKTEHPLVREEFATPFSWVSLFSILRID